MGITKRHLEEQEFMQSQALTVLMRVDAIEQCDFHDGCYFEGSGDVADAYPVANAMINRGEIELPDGMSRSEFSQLIKDTFEEYYVLDECSYCAHVRERD
jgi:hypothetical protein